MNHSAAAQPTPQIASAPSIAAPILVALALGVLTLGALWPYYSTGMYAIDEVHYLWAGTRWVEAASFNTPNGFEAHPSHLLQPLHPTSGDITPAAGQLTTFIPALGTFWSAAAVALAGPGGLYLLNALAFMLLLIVVARMASGLAMRQAEDALHLPGWAPAALAVVATVGGTCLPEYAISAMNHLPALLLLLLAIAVHPAWQPTSTGNATGWRLALVSGLLVGLGTGLRLQEVVGMAVLGIACLAAPWRQALARACAFLCGAAVPLGAMAWVNLQRFGTPNPFTYGMQYQSDLVPLLGTFSRHPLLLLPLLASALGLHLALALPASPLHRIVLRAARHPHAVSVSAWAAGIVLAALLLSPLMARHSSTRFLGIGLFPGAEDAQWLGFGPIGFWLGPINSLLQAAPLAALLLLSPWLLAISHHHSSGSSQSPLTRPMLLLAALAWAHLLFALLLRNDGGHLPNPRYLLQPMVLGALALPALVISLLGNGSTIPGAFPRCVAIAGLMLAAILSAAMFSARTALDAGQARAWQFLGKMPEDALPAVASEWLLLLADRMLPILLVLLVVPAAIALSIPALRSLNEWPARLVWCRGALAFCLPALIILPGASHFVLDVPAAYAFREEARKIHHVFERFVPDNSVMFVTATARPAAVRLATSRDVWVAHASRSNWTGATELLIQIAQAQSRAHLVVLDAAPEVPPAERALMLAHFRMSRLPGPLPLQLLTLDPSPQPPRSDSSAADRPAGGN